MRNNSTDIITQIEIIMGGGAFKTFKVKLVTLPTPNMILDSQMISKFLQTDS